MIEPRTDHGMAMLGSMRAGITLVRELVRIGGSEIERGRAHRIGLAYGARVGLTSSDAIVRSGRRQVCRQTLRNWRCRHPDLFESWYDPMGRLHVRYLGE